MAADGIDKARKYVEDNFGNESVEYVRRSVAHSTVAPSVTFRFGAGFNDVEARFFEPLRRMFGLVRADLEPEDNGGLAAKLYLDVKRDTSELRQRKPPKSVPDEEEEEEEVKVAPKSRTFLYLCIFLICAFLLALIMNQ